MAKSLLSAFAAMALAMFASTAAQAVVVMNGSKAYTFDFSDAWRVSSSGSGAGNSMTFRSKEEAQLQVKVTAWSIDKSPNLTTNSTLQASYLASNTDDIVTAATLKLWNGGLGVQNKYESDTEPNHAIDNGVDSTRSGWTTYSKYMVDFVMLQFSYEADVNSMTTGYVSGDSDASVRVGDGPTNNPALWNSTPALDGKKVFGSTGALELNDLVTMSNSTAGMNPIGGSSPGSRSVDAGNGKHGMVWLLGALYGTDKNDYFKLDALGISVYPTIPEPSTWLTMILGFGFIGWTMRRRNMLAKTGATSLG